MREFKSELIPDKDIYTTAVHADSTMSTIPGPTSFPIVGNLLQLRKAKVGQHYEFYLDLAKQYGEIYRLFIGRQLIVRLNSTDIIREAFLENADVFGGRKDFLLNGGRGLLCSSGESYRQLQSVFKEKMMNFETVVSDKRTYEDIYLSETQHLKEYLNESQQSPIEISQLLVAANLNIILNILFGIRYDYEDDTLKDMSDAEIIFSKDQPPISILEFLFPFLKPLLGNLEQTTPQKTLSSLIEAEIKKCKESFDKDNIRGLCDMFILAGNNEEITGETFSENNILCAFFDIVISICNIGVLLSWCIVYMVKFPEIQRKCRDEINMVVGSKRTVKLANRGDMNYNQATIKEISLQSNVVPIFVPRIATADGYLRGHFIPEGSRRCLGATIADDVSFLMFTNLLQNFAIDKYCEKDDFDFKAHLGFIMSTPNFRFRTLFE
ncbi:hypothetical protein KUTeg_009920 [Tegillarca granosa]|uniref:Cytochrome P450 n=1 Tax=Tegillarca granosa TaxID=220873 RepID=A0ABQ9F598_TEGGR|nr:hypothetical protein KUTeg_009920 [Tegillarca granosa]